MHEKEDEQTKIELEKRNKCESAIYQTESSLETYKDNPALTDEDKAWFEQKMEVLKKMKEENDYSNLDSVYDEVMGKWNSVAIKAYKPNGDGNQFDFNSFAEMFKQGQTNQQPNTQSTKQDDVEEV